MASIDAFLRWAEGRGVRTSGIELKAIPGCGIGIVAARDLEEGQVIIDVPVKAHRSLHSVPKSIADRLPADSTIHALLAADLAINRSEISEWFELMPPLSDFESSLPFLWPAPLRSLLPSAAAAPSNKHRDAFEREWKVFAASFPEETAAGRDAYLHAWCIVNTRSFYYETPGMLRYPWHDRLTLLPVADMFNHAGTGCAVQFSAEGHTVITDRSYRKGDELCTSYGQHSNDYLLAEYGFILYCNPWDELCLDDVISPRLDAKQKKLLKASSSSEGLTIGAATLEIGRNLRDVIQSLCSSPLPPKRLANGTEKPQSTSAAFDSEQLLQGFLNDMLEKAEEMLAKVQDLKVGSERQRRLLEIRWREIRALVSRVVEKVKNGA